MCHRERWWGQGSFIEGMQGRGSGPTAGFVLEGPTRKRLREKSASIVLACRGLG